MFLNIKKIKDILRKKCWCFETYRRSKCVFRKKFKLINVLEHIEDLSVFLEEEKLIKTG